MIAKELVESYLLERKTARTRSSWEADRLESELNKLYSKRFKGSYLDSDGGSPTSLEIIMDIDKLFPGIEILTPLVKTDEFELSYLKNKGWSVGTATVRNYGAQGNKVRLFLQKDERPLAKKPRYLYHGAPLSSKRSILTKGLSPRPASYDRAYRYSQPRVYFATRLDLDELVHLIGSKVHEEGMVVFRLDTTKFKKFNIFTDSTFDDEYDPSELHPDDMPTPRAVYTLTKIPPQHLEHIYDLHRWEGDQADLFRS